MIYKAYEWFYQRSSNVVNDNIMFCTKIKLLTQKIALTVALFQILY